MFNVTLFCFAFILLVITHGIADYWAQTDWQAQNKSKQGWFGLALWSHIVVYTALFIPAFLVIESQFPLTATQKVVGILSVGLLHVLMDQRGFLNWFCEKTKGWKAGGADLFEAYEGKQITTGALFTFATIAAVRLHVGIEMDQKYHYLCLGLTAAFLAWS